MESLLYFIFWAGLIFVMMRYGCGAHIMGHGHRGSHRKKLPPHAGPSGWVPPETNVDPVCGMTVQTGTAKSAVIDGTVYYFCSSESRERFEATSRIYPASVHGGQPRQQENPHG